MELKYDLVNNIVCMKAEYFDETNHSGGLGGGLHRRTCRKLRHAFPLMQQVSKNILIRNYFDSKSGNRVLAESKK